MLTSLQGESLDISADPSLGPQSRLEAPSSGHQMSVPLDVAPDPDRQRSPAEELDIEEVDEADRQIIESFQAALNRTWWLARKKRLEKLLTRSFGQACTTASAGLLVTFICAGLLLYQQKAIQEPTLALAQASTAATVASEAAARWTAYTEWVFNVCPAEIVRYPPSNLTMNGVDVYRTGTEHVHARMSNCYERNDSTAP